MQNRLLIESQVTHQFPAKGLKALAKPTRPLKTPKASFFGLEKILTLYISI